jgi:crotonobetainyl-CoA:carnitine CoA-transferase CaiB-like acyl-CoA transferase
VLAEIMNAWLSTRTSAQAVADFESARIPAGPVWHLGEVLEDPQVRARELLKYVEYPGAPKPVPLADTAVRLSATPGGIRHRAPLLGEHTDEVLAELGYGPGDIKVLRQNEVV